MVSLDWVRLVNFCKGIEHWKSQRDGSSHFEPLEGVGHDSF